MRDYEACARCGFDHEYEPEQAQKAHAECSACQHEIAEDEVGCGPDHECSQGEFICDICHKRVTWVGSMGRDSNGDPDAPDVCFFCLSEEDVWH